MNNFNSTMGGANSIYPKTTSPSYFNPTYGASAPTNNIIWVQGIEGAKAWQLSPNSMAILLDSEVENKMYIKVSDNIGMTSLRIFNFVEEVKTVEQIFSDISAHMIEGLMIHSQMSDYFNFLGLKGYAKCHKYHFFEESCNYKKLNWYFLTHYNKIVEEKPFKNPGIIPENWYQYSRQEVSTATKKTAIQDGFVRWLDWETETKKFYESMYHQLIVLKEIAGAAELEKYIKDVDKELAAAHQKYLELKATEFDMSDIIQEQDHIYKKYKKKMQEICLC